MCSSVAAVVGTFVFPCYMYIPTLYTRESPCVSIIKQFARAHYGGIMRYECMF